VYLASEGALALAREDYDSEAHFAAQFIKKDFI